MEIGGRLFRNSTPSDLIRGRIPVLRAGLGCPVVAVQALAHFLARLEKRDALLIDRHMRAGARIAAGAGGTMLHRKRTESTQLDPVAARQRGDDLIENRVHNVLDIPLVEMRVVLGDALTKFGRS